MADLKSAEDTSSASVNLRPHCQAPKACVARTIGKHCPKCIAATPESRARKAAAAARNPELAERRRQACLARNSDPERRQRASETMKRRLADPKERELHIERLRSGIKRAMAKPEFREQRRQQGLKQAVLINSPEVRARNASPEVRARAGRTHTERDLGWCPPAYRELYFGMSRTLSAAERRAAVEEQIQIDARRVIEDFNRRQRERIAREAAQSY